jgi:hypothetical protein
MTDTYIKTSEHNQTPVVTTDERYEVFSPTIIDLDDFTEDNEIEYFPLFDSQNDIFKELPDYVWENQRACRLLLQLALVYKKKRNPSYSYTPIRAVKEADFLVLEWIFQDKRFTFYFSEVEDDKYSILFFNAEEKTFVNAVKKIDPEHYKEIAEEVLSFIS